MAFYIVLTMVFAMMMGASENVNAQDAPCPAFTCVDPPDSDDWLSRRAVMWNSCIVMSDVLKPRDQAASSCNLTENGQLMVLDTIEKVADFSNLMYNTWSPTFYFNRGWKFWIGEGPNKTGINPYFTNSTVVYSASPETSNAFACQYDCSLIKEVSCTSCLETAQSIASVIIGQKFSDSQTMTSTQLCERAGMVNDECIAHADQIKNSPELLGGWKKEAMDAVAHKLCIIANNCPNVFSTTTGAVTVTLCSNSTINNTDEVCFNCESIDGTGMQEFSRNKMCDGTADCIGGIDESEASCPGVECDILYSISFNPTDRCFKCSDSTQIIPYSYVCDRYPGLDCPDNSDEDPALCPPIFCENETVPLNYDQVCGADEKWDCPDGRDQSCSICTYVNNCVVEEVDANAGS